MKGYMYILECADGSYYTGSTNNLERRLQQHQNGKGPIIPKNTYLLSWYILKNFNVSTKHFIARSRYRDGAGKRKKHWLTVASTGSATCRRITHNIRERNRCLRQAQTPMERQARLRQAQAARQNETVISTGSGGATKWNGDFDKLNHLKKQAQSPKKTSSIT